MSYIKRTFVLKKRVRQHQNRVAQCSPLAWAVTDITDSALKGWLKAKIGTPCVYCGDAGQHIDHIVPLSKGGAHSFHNLQWLCKTCNMAKGALSEEEFWNWIKKVTKHPRSQS